MFNTGLLMEKIQGVTESIQKYSRRGKQEASAARKKGMVRKMERYVARSIHKKWQYERLARRLLEMKQMGGHMGHTFE